MKKVVVAIITFLIMSTAVSAEVERAFVTLSIGVPDNYKNEIKILYVNEDTGKTFQLTLSEKNKYSIFMSLPVGVYSVQSVQFDDVETYNLVVPELHLTTANNTYTVVANLEEKTIERNTKSTISKTSIIVILLIVSNLVLLLLLVVSRSKRK